MAVTSQFITDDFVLESVLLQCKQIKSNHTSEHLAEEIKCIVDEFYLEKKGSIK